MLQRIRLAMQTRTFEKYGEKFDGAVEADESSSVPARGA
jgi:hypothetical protein